jgi:hypothetical protein
MALMLFIVSRDDPALYRLLREEFADEPDVQVILDRRARDRDVESAPLAEPRLPAERRSRPEIDERLYSLGWAIVHPRPD